MKLEVGKFYQTRDGHKAGPVTKPNNLTKWPFAASVNYDDRHYQRHFTPTGALIDEGLAAPEDLVAEWTNEPTQNQDNHTQIEDEEVVQRFNKLVKDGRVEFCVSEYKNEWAEQDAEQRLKPVIRTTTLKDSGFKVVVGADKVEVGCVVFTPRLDLLAALQGLIRGSLYTTTGLTNGGAAGIRHDNGRLSWDDAKQLAEFLLLVKE